MTHLTMHEPTGGGDPVVDLSSAPLPTKKTLDMRRNLPFSSPGSWRSTPGSFGW